MPSPFGRNRSADTYYQHAGAGRHYVWDWTGLPAGPTWAAESRALGDHLESQGPSVLHSGPEQSRIYNGLNGFSSNQKRLALVAGLSVAGWLIWKRMNKKR